MTETDQESRLRRYLAAYERLCEKYSLVIYNGNTLSFDERVHERFWSGLDMLTDQLKELGEGGICE